MARILVIDDERDIRENLAEILEAEGYEVRVAESGRDGLAVLHDWAPDAIVLDLMMPDMAGREFRRVQLARPDLADVPTVAFTGYRDLARDLSGVDVIEKGDRTESLLILLHERIQKRKPKSSIARTIRNAAIIVGGLATLAKVLWDLIKGRKYQ